MLVLGSSFLFAFLSSSTPSNKFMTRLAVVASSRGVNAQVEQRPHTPPIYRPASYCLRACDSKDRRAPNHLDSGFSPVANLLCSLSEACNVMSIIRLAVVINEHI